jgi:hypothetical protein
VGEDRSTFLQCREVLSARTGISGIAAQLAGRALRTACYRDHRQQLK